MTECSCRRMGKTHPPTIRDSRVITEKCLRSNIAESSLVLFCKKLRPLKKFQSQTSLNNHFMSWRTMGVVFLIRFFPLPLFPPFGIPMFLAKIPFIWDLILLSILTSYFLNLKSYDGPAFYYLIDWNILVSLLKTSSEFILLNVYFYRVCPWRKLLTFSFNDINDIFNYDFQGLLPLDD